MKKFILFACIWLLGSLAIGQPCYEILLKEGNTFFDSSKYDLALLNYIALNSCPDKPVDNVIREKINLTVGKWVSELDSINDTLNSANLRIVELLNRTKLLYQLSEENYKKAKFIYMASLVQGYIDQGKMDDAFAAAYYAYKLYSDSIQNNSNKIPLNIKRALGDAIFAKFHYELQTGHSDLMKIISNGNNEFSLINRDYSITRWPDYKWNNSTQWSKGKEIMLGSKKHDNFILSGSYSRNGKQLIFTTKNNHVKAWNLDDNTLNSNENHTASVLKGEMLADGRILSVSFDGFARIWTQGEANSEEIKLGDFPITDFVVLDDGITVIFKSFRKVFALNITEPEEIITFDHDGAIIYSIDISPEQKQLLTSSADNTIKIWSLDGLVSSVLVHDSEVYVGSFSPNPSKKTIISGTKNGKTWRWKISKEGELVDKNSHLETNEKASMINVAFSEDGNLPISWREDVVYFPTSAKVIKNHSGKINTLRFSSDNQYFLTSSDDGTSKLWSMSGEVLMNMNLKSPVKDAFFSPIGDKVIAVTKDGRIFICPLPLVAFNEVASPTRSNELQKKIEEMFKK